MGLFRNRYRIESSRWSGYDYSSAGLYFITICTKPRYGFFGRIIKKTMVLSDNGVIVDECWRSIPDHYNNVDLGVFSIMPDHFHGIIIISQPNGRDEHDGCAERAVETGHAPSLQLPTRFNAPNSGNTTKIQFDKNNPGPCPENLPTIGNIVGSFKSAVTNKIHAAGKPDFGWQTRYHDRVIRNETELNRIDQYIRDNPEKWLYEN